MSIKIGITGGIGSGKSVVSRLLSVAGIPVYISDVETKRLMLTDDSIRAGLTQLLGQQVYVGRELNKPLLASYVFGAPEQAARVNAIVHPQVKLDFRRWAQSQLSRPIVGIESAILIEAGFAAEVDAIVMVSAPLEVRIARVMARDAVSRSEVEQRIRSQMDDEEKCRRANFIVRNDGITPLMPQVLELIALLSENNPYLCPLKKVELNK